MIAKSEGTEKGTVAMGMQTAQEIGDKNAQLLASLPPCPVETTLNFIGNKWQVLILRDLSLNDVMRFKELQRSIGAISQKVLTANLRTMEQSGLVHREVYAEVPPRVEYSLTPTGQTLQPVIDAMWAWGGIVQGSAA